FLPQAIASSLFFISLPLQGLLWLGKRAQTELEPAMLQWYNELFAKMIANGYDAQMGKNKPRYLELAELLKDMFDKMDKTFTKEQF
ncbi:terminus macrodomain insulation protein YfbV, partial [Pseudoalteromonas tetraodonis]